MNTLNKCTKRMRMKSRQMVRSMKRKTPVTTSAAITAATRGRAPGFFRAFVAATGIAPSFVAIRQPGTIIKPIPRTTPAGPPVIIRPVPLAVTAQSLPRETTTGAASTPATSAAALTSATAFIAVFRRNGTRSKILARRFGVSTLSTAVGNLDDAVA